VGDLDTQRGAVSIFFKYTKNISSIRHAPPSRIVVVPYLLGYLFVARPLSSSFSRVALKGPLLEKLALKGPLLEKLALKGPLLEKLAAYSY
jgi:hypothetical protein